MGGALKRLCGAAIALVLAAPAQAALKVPARVSGTGIALAGQKPRFWAGVSLGVTVPRRLVAVGDPAGGETAHLEPVEHELGEHAVILHQRHVDALGATRPSAISAGSRSASGSAAKPSMAIAAIVSSCRSRSDSAISARSRGSAAGRRSSPVTSSTSAWPAPPDMRSIRPATRATSSAGWTGLGT